MSGELTNQSPFIPADLQDRLEHFDGLHQKLAPQEGVHLDATAVEVMTGLSWAMHRELMLLLVDKRVKADSYSSIENYTTSLIMDAYHDLRRDRQYQLYKGLCELMTAKAIVYNDTDAASFGRALGQRVITERARSGSVALLSACDTTRGGNDLFGSDIHSPRNGAHQFYLRTGKPSPLSQVQKKHGERFQDLTDRLIDGDYEDPIPRVDLESNGLRGRAKFSLRLTKAINRIAKNAKSPDTLADAIEESYETFLVPYGLPLTNDEMKFIGRFSSRYNDFLSGPKMEDKTVLKDPRVRYVRVLCENLGGLVLGEQASIFNDGVKFAVKHEQALQK